MFNTIKDINPDVIILQEVIEKKDTAEIFGKIGFTEHSFCSGPEGKNFGNMILSKIKFAGQPKKHNFKTNKIKHSRCYIRVEFDLSKSGHRNLVVYGTHLEVENKGAKKGHRFDEIKELVRLAAREKGKNVVIGADFNTTRGKPALTYLESHGFKDCFTQAHLKEPRFTHWTGQVLDYLYLWNWYLPIDGCYLYYSAASDHMPVIMDIRLTGTTATPSVPKKTGEPEKKQTKAKTPAELKEEENLNRAIAASLKD